MEMRKYVNGVAGLRVVAQWCKDVDRDRHITIDMSPDDTDDASHNRNQCSDDARREATERLLENWQRRVQKKRRSDDILQ